MVLQLTQSIAISSGMLYVGVVCHSRILAMANLLFADNRKREPHHFLSSSLLHCSVCSYAAFSFCVAALIAFPSCLKASKLVMRSSKAILSSSRIAQNRASSVSRRTIAHPSGVHDSSRDSSSDAVVTGIFTAGQSEQPFRVVRLQEERNPV